MFLHQRHRISFLTSLERKQREIALNTLPPVLAVSSHHSTNVSL